MKNKKIALKWVNSYNNGNKDGNGTLYFYKHTTSKEFKKNTKMIKNNKSCTFN